MKNSDQQKIKHESSALFGEKSDLNHGDCTRYEYKQASCVKTESSAMSLTFA